MRKRDRGADQYQGNSLSFSELDTNRGAVKARTGADISREPSRNLLFLDYLVGPYRKLIVVGIAVRHSSDVLLSYQHLVLHLIALVYEAGHGPSKPAKEEFC
jgi:hypothetical protein